MGILQSETLRSIPTVAYSGCAISTAWRLALQNHVSMEYSIADEQWNLVAPSRQTCLDQSEDRKNLSVVFQCLKYATTSINVCGYVVP